MVFVEILKIFNNLVFLIEFFKLAVVPCRQQFYTLVYPTINIVTAWKLTEILFEKAKHESTV